MVTVCYSTVYFKYPESSIYVINIFLILYLFN